MTVPNQPAAEEGRVSQTSPDFTARSYQVWDEALNDPEFKRALDEGLEDLKAGRTRPWGEIRSNSQSA
jgi:hypothetical protein